MGDFDFDENEDFEVNLENEEEWKYQDYSQPMKVGKYNVRITDVEIKPSKNNPKNKVYHINCEVQDEPYDGRNIMAWETWSEKTLGRMKTFLQAALGHPVTTVNPKRMAEELCNRPVIASVTIKTHKGKYRENIDFWFPVGSTKTGPSEHQPPLPKLSEQEPYEDKEGPPQGDEPF